MAKKSPRSGNSRWNQPNMKTALCGSPIYSRSRGRPRGRQQKCHGSVILARRRHGWRYQRKGGSARVMYILTITYPKSADSNFDFEYFRSTHLPEVGKAFKPFGL